MQNVTGISGSGTFDIVIASLVAGSPAPMAVTDDTLGIWPDFKSYKWGSRP